MSKEDTLSDTRFTFIRISNRNRLPSSVSASDFDISLGEDVQLMGAKNFWVHMCSLPHVFPNIYEGINDLTFNFDNGSSTGSGTVTVDPGQYTTAEVLSEIKTQIDAAATPGTITFTQDSNTSLVSFTTSGITTIDLFSSDDDPLSTLSYPIGLTDSILAATTGTFSYAPALQGEKMVFLHSPQIIPCQTRLSNGHCVSSFVSIPIKVNYREEIIYESRGSEVDRCVFNHEKPLINMNIKLRAEDGRILDVGENQEIIIVLKVFY